MIDLNERVKEVRQANEKWRIDLETGKPIKRKKGEFLMLVISEIAEAIEGERKNLMDDHLPHRKMAEVELADAYIRLLDYAGEYGLKIVDKNIDRFYTNVIHGSEHDKGFRLFEIVCGLTAFEWCYWFNEYLILSMCIKSINDYCEDFGYDLEGAYHEKMAYNATRKDHTREERLKENGKKF